MSLKEHEYIRQTLERYTNCKLEISWSHLDIALGATAKIGANWRTVAHRLSSEW